MTTIFATHFVFTHGKPFMGECGKIQVKTTNLINYDTMSNDAGYWQNKVRDHG